MDNCFDYLMGICVPITVDLSKHTISSKDYVYFDGKAWHIPVLNKIPLLPKDAWSLEKWVYVYKSIVPPKHTGKLYFPTGNDDTFSPEYENIPFYEAKRGLELTVLFHILQKDIVWKGSHYFWKHPSGVILRKEWFNND